MFNGARIGAGAEVRIGGVVHVNSVLPPGATVPIHWIAVGDPAQCFPPREHEKIWEVQRTMDVPGTVFGADRSTPTPESIRRYANDEKRVACR